MSSVKRVRYCDLCGSKGKGLETRERDGVIRRRFECGRGHRFTTLEIRPQVGNKRVLTTRIRALA